MDYAVDNSTFTVSSVYAAFCFGLAAISDAAMLQGALGRDAYSPAYKGVMDNVRSSGTGQTNVV